MPPDDVQRLLERADTLDRIIREAQQIKAVVEERLQEFRAVGRPSPRIERRHTPRKAR